MQGFINNIFYVYFFSCIVILNYGSFSKMQKIALIYTTTFAMKLCTDTKTSVSLIVLVLFMFVLEEYLTQDKVKLQLITKIWDKILDFLYEFIFQDAGGWMCITLALSCNKCYEWLNKTFHTNKVYYIVVFIFFFISVHRLCTCKFVMKSFTDIKSYFDEYVERDLHLSDPEVRERLELLTELEDRSYFIRKNSYNWISLDFFRYKKGQRKQRRQKKNGFHTLGKRWKKCWLILCRKGIRYCFGKMFDRMREKCWNCQRYLSGIKRRIRGCSTLEMQFMRVKGLELGYNCTVRRKFFEFIYSYLFFSGLKRYYQHTVTSKEKYFKEFILFVYIHTIPVQVNRVYFSCIAEIFVDRKAIRDARTQFREFPKECLYVGYLALTGAEVSCRRMSLYPETVIRHGLDIQLCVLYAELIRNGKITPEKRLSREKIETALKKQKKQKIQSLYLIQNAIVPCAVNGRYYGTPNWPSYGQKGCRIFAEIVYWRIWENYFTSYAGTKEDLLRDIKNMRERKITEENTRRFISQAAIGAVIRICDDIRGLDINGTHMHSQILVDKDEEGFTIYESRDEGTRIEYYTWTKYVKEYKVYKYFKYIKWPESNCEGMQ